MAWQEEAEQGLRGGPGWGGLAEMLSVLVLCQTFLWCSNEIPGAVAAVAEATEAVLMGVAAPTSGVQPQHLALCRAPVGCSGRRARPCWGRLLPARLELCVPKISGLSPVFFSLPSRKIVAEYEKTIAQMIGECCHLAGCAGQGAAAAAVPTLSPCPCCSFSTPEDEQRTNMTSQKNLQQLTMEKDQALADLNSVERSLSDLFRRYENLKGVLEGFKKVCLGFPISLQLWFLCSHTPCPVLLSWGSSKKQELFFKKTFLPTLTTVSIILSEQCLRPVPTQMDVLSFPE